MKREKLGFGYKDIKKNQFKILSKANEKIIISCMLTDG